jgi:chemosensory pili system protein ChpA (sensor histidine kinase/response regulator)
MPQNTDLEVLRIFQQEVRAALPELKRHLERLAENPERRDALQKAHRLVQGLSGAASLLGLANWSETGSAVGHFLDEVVSGSQSMTAEAAQDLQSTLELIEAELSSPERPEPPRFELEEMDGDLSLDAPPPEMMDGLGDDCRFELVDVDDPEALQAVPMQPAAADDLPQDETADAELMEVFQEEAEEHLGVIASSLRDLSDGQNDSGALQNVRRSMHTIKGAAGMVGLRTAQRLAHRSEDLLDKLSESDAKPNPAIIPLLQATADLIQDITRSQGADEAMRGAVIEICARYDAIAAGAVAAGQEEYDVPDLSFEEAAPEPTPAANVTLEEDAPAGGELLEVFQEEAAEHLGLLAANLRTLQTDPGDRAVLQEIRRSMHTIKGAAGMVGLRSAQRVAHGSEDLLDRLYESATNPTAEILNLIQRTADVIQDISEAGRANDETRAAVLTLDAEYAALLNGTQKDTNAALPDPGEMDLFADDAFAIVEETVPATADDLEQDHVADGELLEVFQEEAEEHLGLIAKNLRALRETPNAPEVLQEVRRSMHTIKGAAGMVGLRSAQRVAHRSEDLLDVLYESGARLDNAVLDLIQESADLIQTVTEAKGADAAGRQRALELSARYDAFLRAIKTDDQAAEEAGFVAPIVEEQGAVVVEAPAPVAEPATPQASRSFAAGKSPSGQYARVPLERVEELVRLVSELIVSRSNFEQHCRRFTRESGELKLSGERITQLTGKLETDYAVKAMAEGGDSAGSPLAYAGGASAGSFDSLEFDRYSEFHLLSRDLNEAAADISAAGAQLHGVAGEFQNSLVRLSRLTGEVQDGLMRLRMAPISSLENRLHRTVRVAAQACNKKVRLEVAGGEVELDKSVLEEITGPLEHLLRNAVDHGIESPEKRAAAGKPEEGVVTLRAYLEGARAAIEVRDDGAGLDLDALRSKAVERGIHSQRAAGLLTQDDTYELIFHPGFSTAAKVSEVSGRGVGMDVVRSAIESLNGSIGIHSERGGGSAFSIGLPTSLAVARVLMVQANSQVFAAPMHCVRQVIKLHPKDVGDSPQGAYVDFEGKRYKAVRLADALNLPGEADPEPDRLTAMIIDAGKRSFVLLADRILEAAEVVVKNMGGLLRRVHGISAATIAGDGSVVLILNPSQLVDPPPVEFRHGQMEARDEINDQQLKVLIVDDSLSVRKVVTRLLESADWITVAARDGIEALEALKEMPAPPDAILCDVEMPRMDGYELASHLKSGVFAQIPILMLTSRAGKKHRDRAKEIGVDDYLIKPFQDEALLTAIRGAVDAARRGV